MSRRNGQRARFQINRKRKLLRRIVTRAIATPAPAATAAAADKKA